MATEKIEAIAELLHDYVFADNTDYENLERYLEEIGIEIFYSNGLENADGYLRINKESKKPRIVVKTPQFQPRQRFTMAHELGHLIWHYRYLPWKSDEWFEKNTNNDLNNGIMDVKTFRGGDYNGPELIKEREANEFAAAFLMPESKILSLATDYKSQHGKISKDQLIDLVTSKFGVSRPAAARRIERLLS